MSYLLDTHTFIWFLEGSDQLSSKARKAIESENAINYVSIATLWEMAIKISLKKLELNMPFEFISDKIAQNGFQILPIAINDTLTLSTLPFHHRDPFDRIIITQCINNKLIAISKDQFFDSYSITTIW